MWGRQQGQAAPWCRQHLQILHRLGQASLGTRRERDNHPSQPPYLGVVRPTVMDIIETPKIDRLHRLGAVSLKVRAGWGGQEMGTANCGTILPPTVLADPVLLPSKQGTSCSQCMQQAVTGVIHSGLVGYVGFGPSCKVPPPALPVYGEPCGQLRPWGEPQSIYLHCGGNAGNDAPRVSC